MLRFKLVMKTKLLIILLSIGILGTFTYKYFQHQDELTDDEKQQEFILAVEGNDSKKVTDAIKSGINLNRPIYGRLPLVVACEKDHMQIVDLLVRGGADVNLSDLSGNTALLVAAKMKHSLAINYLLKAGADPDLKLPNGWTLLHLLAYDGRTSDIKNFLDFMRTTKKKVNLVDSKDKHGITPLMYACERGHIAAVQLLLQGGANPNSQSNTGMTPLLFLASSHGLHVNASLYLLKSGANLNLGDRDGITPLMAAAYRNHEALVVLFQSRGSNRDLRNKAGKTAADIALQRGNQRIASYLKK